MPKFAYVVEPSIIYRYSVQPDGSLSPLDPPVSCENAIGIACSNASRFQEGGDYIFVVSNGIDGESGSGISIYHVESDGSLTMRIDHSQSDTVSEDAFFITAMYLSGPNAYFIYIDSRSAKSRISGYQFIAPNSITALGPRGEPAISLPPGFQEQMLSYLEIVSPDGAPLPYIYALYPAELVSYTTRVDGRLKYAGFSAGGYDSASQIAAPPNGDFAYVPFFDGSVLGYKMQAGNFNPLGSVTQLPSFGTAAITSRDGKYLFISVAASPVDGGGTDAVFSFKIGPDGSLTPLDQKPCGPVTTMLVTEPGGQYLYALAGEGVGIIYIYEINADGTLTPKPPESKHSGRSVFGMVVLEMLPG
ncbi:lactonase family protein [Phyllobacterium leguminum]|uniref:6-phosphogluconolactonase (Cycloisomerase 2 family) n=1 Tax=Phyllobacterium leguminum TaxID=314237 RepID=A0A318TEP1_9HYPH|nr:lactonase family protein [Phyllobacterium leguminum]PYE89983.1 hypothetical protein C7477_10270 [Phyllobacterium leguminum]